MQPVDVKLSPEWKAALADEFIQPYFYTLTQAVRQEYRAHTVYPPGGLIFNALDLTPLSHVRVVLLGQDPYHGPGQAHGLCFSVPHGVPPPPSLVNIFKELEADQGIATPRHGCLEAWARQGVLLLNASLTVRAHQAGSHAALGWGLFTDAVIRAVSRHQPAVAFLLWGAFAQRKAELIDSQKHAVLAAPHPSPLSAHRGFFGSRPFSQANAFLTQRGLPPIDWKLG
jgi:uracil-DNA glycosylase